MDRKRDEAVGFRDRRILLLTVMVLAAITLFTAIYTSWRGGEERKLPALKGIRVLMIIAPHNFRDEELVKPREILEGAGAEIIIASKTRDPAEGMGGLRVNPDIALSEARVEDYDAIAFIGGPGAAQYFQDEEVLSLARHFYERGKIVAAICIAPGILAKAGILERRRATVWSSPTDKSMVEMIEEGGATYTGEDVVVDGNIITASGPGAAEEFGRALAEQLASPLK